MISWPLLMGSTALALPPSTGTDPYWEDVVLMCGFDNQSLTDESSRGHSIVAAGDGVGFSFENTPPITGASASLYLQNAASTFNYASIRDNLGDFNFGTNDFTVELWLNCNWAGYSGVILGQNNNSISGGWELARQADSGAHYNEVGVNIKGISSIYSMDKMSYDTWYHTAFCRYGTSLMVYLNGNLSTTWSVDASQNIGGNSLLPLYLARPGWSGWGDYRYRGCLDEIRITKGVCRYTESFIRPTTKFPRG